MQLISGEGRKLTGKLEVMMGPMRSNKTAELLRRADMRRQYAHQHVLVLKPSDDTKGGPGLVESRNPLGHGKMKAHAFNSANPWEVLDVIAEKEQQIGKRVECIAIDEGQFVDSLFLFVKQLLDQDHDVLVAGLDLDFRANPFGEMLNLSWLVNAYGGSITECMAYCSCGARALYSQRLIDGSPASYDCPVKVPGDTYEPRCAEHFVLPGRPH
ncbi:MAG: thymidine kinase [Terracidiphilus sp.]|nr:thymidine kinase [Terracidiphilus sp.]